MENLKCIDCGREFDNPESLNQHRQAKHSVKEKAKTNKINNGKLITILIISALIIAIIYLALMNSKKPSIYDNFAKCLTSKGAIIYGNDFCPYTGSQLNSFGKSERYLTYVKCANNKQLCDEKGIKKTPTWEINGTMYEGIQGFEKLGEIAGCSL